MAQNIKKQIQQLKDTRQDLPGKNSQLKQRIELLRDRYQENKPTPTFTVTNTPKGVGTPNPNPQAPNQPKPGATGNGPNNQAKPEDESKPATPAYTATDPRDATYWADLARIQYETNQTINNLNTEQVYANTDYDQFMNESKRAEKQDILSTKQAANRGGAFYSSATGEALGRVGQDYFTSRSDAERNKMRDDALRKAMIEGARQGLSIDELAAYAEAVARQSGLEMDRPSPVAPKPVAPPSPKPPDKKPDNKPGDGNGGKKDDKPNKGNDDKDKDRIKELQDKLEKASPKERERIKDLIRKLRNG